MTYRVNTTRYLNQEARKGALIVAVTGDPKIVGEAVVYEPRHSRDGFPWRSTVQGFTHHRLPGSWCAAIRPAKPLCGRPVLFGGEVLPCIVPRAEHGARAHTTQIPS